MSDIPGPKYTIAQHAGKAIGLSEILKEKDWTTDKELVLITLDYGVEFLTNAFAVDEEADRQINEQGTEGRDATYELSYSALRELDKVAINSKDDRESTQLELRQYLETVQKLRDSLNTNQAVTVSDEQIDELALFFETVSHIDEMDASQFATGCGCAVAL